VDRKKGGPEEMRIFFKKVADSIYKILTPSEEEAARMVERYKLMNSLYHDDSN
jgi:hypothetical protein